MDLSLPEGNPRTVIASEAKQSRGLGDCHVANAPRNDRACGYGHVILLVPRLRLGTHIFRALPGNYLAFRPIMEAEPPGHAFPG